MPETCCRLSLIKHIQISQQSIILGLQFVRIQELIKRHLLTNMPSCTQLAHVADRSPLLLPLRAEAKDETNVFCTVVKICPTLVHFLVDGRVSVSEKHQVPSTAIPRSNLRYV